MSRTPFPLPRLKILRKPARPCSTTRTRTLKSSDYRYHAAIKAPIARMRKRAAPKNTSLEVRHSRVHGYGVFALRRIRKGHHHRRIISATRVTHEEANARYADKDPVDGHTFLFTVDAKTVIDAGVNGNDARFVNHGCDPNCQTVDIGKRIFIETLRTIRPGEELAYDYRIERATPMILPKSMRYSPVTAAPRTAAAACW